MRVKAIWIVFVLALGLLAFAATGCGGGGTETVTETVTVSSSDTTTEETTTEEETTTDEEETTTEEETETDETETEATGTDTTPDLSFISNENCRQFVQFASEFSQALSGTGDTDVQEAADTMQKFADEAPEDIRDDFQTLADAYSKIADALEGVDLSSGQTPDAGTIAKLAQLSQEIDSTELTEASQNISDWTQENCTNG
jgi:hypothetical protein